ncbi:hypothetical protein G3I34_02345 [Streptomyces sp. SID8014]|uniref:hypothetical protein n=1 Tax=Streptomyces sp. SID8014 TaxID=2706097 RepID=UPI0013BAF913|nr:hypothetical protein [Streptomyces sp. SID8014]NEC11167.1 hypothetical protein [Streptomyces sp. SID8014]
MPSTRRASATNAFGVDTKGGPLGPAAVTPVGMTAGTDSPRTHRLPVVLTTAHLDHVSERCEL